MLAAGSVLTTLPFCWELSSTCLIVLTLVKPAALSAVCAADWVNPTTLGSAACARSGGHLQGHGRADIDVGPVHGRLGDDLALGCGVVGDVLRRRGEVLGGQGGLGGLQLQADDAGYGDLLGRRILLEQRPGGEEDPDQDGDGQHGEQDVHPAPALLLRLLLVVQGQRARARVWVQRGRRGWQQRGAGVAVRRCGCNDTRTGHRRRRQRATLASRREVVTELDSRLVAVVAVLDQGVQGDQVVGPRHVRDEGRRRLRLLLDVLVGHRDRGVADERRPAGEQLEQQAPGGVQVGARVDRQPLRLLGGQVLRGADDGLRLGHRGRRVGDGPGDAEVHHLDVTVAGDHHVGRFDVTVHDAHPVAVRQRGQHPLGHPRGLRRRQGVLAVEPVAQGLAVDELHHDVRARHLAAVVVGDRLLARVVDSHDRRVGQAAGRLGLPPEPGQEVGIPGQVRAQQLDGHRAPQPSVVAAVYLGHPTATDELADLVATAEQTGGVHGGYLRSLGPGWSSQGRDGVGSSTGVG